VLWTAHGGRGCMRAMLKEKWVFTGKSEMQDQGVSSSVFGTQWADDQQILSRQSPLYRATLDNPSPLTRVLSIFGGEEMEEEEEEEEEERREHSSRDGL
jgi:hypothetical protein